VSSVSVQKDDTDYTGTFVVIRITRILCSVTSFQYRSVQETLLFQLEILLSILAQRVVLAES